MSWQSKDPRGSHWAVKRASARFRVWSNSHPKSPRSPIIQSVSAVQELTGYSANTINSKMWIGQGTIFCPVKRVRENSQLYGQVFHLIGEDDAFIAFTRIDDGK